jgi:hypothetical protein
LIIQPFSQWKLNKIETENYIGMWKLLIIQPFSQSKLNKIGTENCIGIWGCSWCCSKALVKLDLIDFISQFSELRCGRLFFDWILQLKIQTNYKNWVWKEKVG